jgi:hypothetical protein
VTRLFRGTGTRFTGRLSAVLAAVLLSAACGSAEPTATSVASTATATPGGVVVTVPPVSGSVPGGAQPPQSGNEPPALPSVNPMTGLAPSGNVVVAVKIDNTFPGQQYGVAAADVVYVEMVEGGLSRLIVLFHSQLPTEVGPVRSVRSTDPDVLTAYGRPALLFSGGAGGPLDNFASSGLVNASPDVIGSAYWRSPVAAEPYDLHADVARVASGVAGIGTPRNPGFSFVDAPVPAGQRDVDRVGAAFANPISFQWDGGAWTYIRGGAVQTDGAGGATVSFQNLLVQRTLAAPDGTVDSNGVPSYKSASTGSGSFTLYRDGTAIDGTWTRPDAGSPTSYLDAGGSPVPFRPGKTWVVLAPEQIPTSEG